jgi:hypothetical protein
MDRDTNNLIARLYLSEKNLGHVEPAEFAKWASQQLDGGHEQPSLRSLAAKRDDANLSELESQFRESISDLGWEMPSKKSALKQYSKSVMQSIVDGTIEPYDGCSQLYVNSIFLGHPDYLYDWNFLFWSMEDVEPEELNRLIVEEAIGSLGGKSSASPVEDVSLDDSETDEPRNVWDRIKELFGSR